MFYRFYSNKLENEHFSLIGCGRNWLPTNYNNPPSITSAKKWRFFLQHAKKTSFYTTLMVRKSDQPTGGMFYLHLGVSKNNGNPKSSHF